MEPGVRFSLAPANYQQMIYSVMIQSLPPPQFGMADSCAHLQSTTLLLWINHLIMSPAGMTEKNEQVSLCICSPAAYWFLFVFLINDLFCPIFKTKISNSFNSWNLFVLFIKKCMNQKTFLASGSTFFFFPTWHSRRYFKENALYILSFIKLIVCEWPLEGSKYQEMPQISNLHHTAAAKQLIVLNYMKIHDIISK